MESSNERHITDTYRMMKLVRVVETLTDLGRNKEQAIRDVINAYGMTKADVVELIKLIK